jgi:hypothetical protein
VPIGTPEYSNVKSGESRAQPTGGWIMFLVSESLPEWSVRGRGPERDPVMHVLTHLRQRILVQVDLIVLAAPSTKIVAIESTRLL